MTVTNSAKGMRLGRFVRAQADQRPAFQLTERDERILEAVMQYRVLTSAQIRRLFFDFTHKSSQCDARLKGLYHHGFLERHMQPTMKAGDNKPLLYSLAQRGVRYLQEQIDAPIVPLRWQRLQSNGQQLYLDHLLHLNDVRIAFTQACQLLNFRLEKWTLEQTIRRAVLTKQTAMPSASKVAVSAVIPDGVCTFTTGTTTETLFIELDRGTETIEKLQMKCQNYLAEYQRGLLTKHYNVNTLRVLVITTSMRRLQHICQKLKMMAGSEHFAFTCKFWATPENVFTSPIWQQPIAAKPFCLFPKRKLLDVPFEQPSSLSQERIVAVFADWWAAHMFPAVAIATQTEQSKTKPETSELPTSFVLGKWSPEQLLLIRYQLASAKQALLTGVHLLSPEQSAVIRSQLYR